MTRMLFKKAYWEDGYRVYLSTAGTSSDPRSQVKPCGKGKYVDCCAAQAMSEMGSQADVRSDQTGIRFALISGHADVPLSHKLNHPRVCLGILIDVPLGSSKIAVTRQGLNVAQRSPDGRDLAGRIGYESAPAAVARAPLKPKMPVPSVGRGLR
jgi:hypothetical protein